MNLGDSFVGENAIICAALMTGARRNITHSEHSNEAALQFDLLENALKQEP